MQALKADSEKMSKFRGKGFQCKLHMYIILMKEAPNNVVILRLELNMCVFLLQKKQAGENSHPVLLVIKKSNKDTFQHVFQLFRENEQ